MASGGKTGACLAYCQYDIDLENLSEQRTQVRAYVAALRNEAELAGR